MKVLVAVAGSRDLVWGAGSTEAEAKADAAIGVHPEDMLPLRMRAIEAPSVQAVLDAINDGLQDTMGLSFSSLEKALK